MNYFIKNVQYGFTGGPLDEQVVVTIEFELDSKISFFSVVDVGGLFAYYLSEVNIYDKLIDEEYEGIVEKSQITEYNGIKLSNIVDNFEKNNDDYIFLMYLLLILRLDETETITLIRNTNNRILNFDLIKKYDYYDII